MPDTPDYSRYRILSSRVSLQDMGELAARLGAVQRLYREGTILTFDDFRAGFGTSTQLVSGAGSSIVLISSQTFTGYYNARMTCAALAGAEASLTYIFSSFVGGKVGIEVCFIPQQVSAHYLFLAALYTQTRLTEANVRLNFGTNKLQYYGTDSLYHDFGDLRFASDESGVIHFAKLVIDVDNHKYVKFVIDDELFDLSTVELKVSTGTYTAMNEIDVTLAGNSAYNSRVDINHVIITVDEP